MAWFEFVIFCEGNFIFESILLFLVKIVVKGDRNTGKSTLLARFQGKPFREEYLPTNQIQVFFTQFNNILNMTLYFTSLLIIILS